MNRFHAWGLLLFFGISRMASASSFDQGVMAYKERDWPSAMNYFIQTLAQNPQDKLAHQYLDAIGQELNREQAEASRSERKRIFSELVPELSKTPQGPALQAAWSQLDVPESARQNTRWTRWLEEARMHRDLGQLLPANDLVLRVLAEKPDHPAAQRELSDLQSRLRQAIDSSANLLMEERYAAQGFYAYGQADYAAALAAWDRARAIIGQNTEILNPEKRIGTLRFLAYEKVARAKVDSALREKTLRAAFERAVERFKSGKFEEALDGFRRLALEEPEYPQLAYYLVQSETGAEKDRARRLGEKKREALALLYKEGVAHFEREDYAQAETKLSRVLSLDPTHSRAKSYWQIAKSENQKRHDPKAAQLHYESGLIAYASGKLDEAKREWAITLRMNSGHEKARIALAKVQKELTLARELP